MIGLICIVMVVVTAYSAELKVENNSLVSSNEAIQGEIDTLNIKIKSANNVEHIEKVAKGKLGMVYPTDGEKMTNHPKILPWRSKNRHTTNGETVYYFWE